MSDPAFPQYVVLDLPNITGKSTFLGIFKGLSGLEVSFEVLEYRRVGIAGCQYEDMKPFFQQSFNKIKPEFVDTPTGIRYKGNTWFRRHNRQTYIKNGQSAIR